MEFAGLKGYIKEVLKTAEYKIDKEIGCVAAFASLLPGCMTQSNNFEEARDNLIDAIELWITVGLKEGEDIPEINGVRLAATVELIEERGKGSTINNI